MIYEVSINGTPHRVELLKGERTWTCRVDDSEMEVDAAFTARDVLSILVGGNAYEIKREYSLNGDVHVVIGSERFSAEVRDPRSLRARRAAYSGAEGPARVTSPMPGKIVRVLAPEKSEVEAGQGVIVVEAMKMQNELQAQGDGIVREVRAREGENVEGGVDLVLLDPVDGDG